MSDERMRGEVVSPGNVIHHATRFTFDAATTCGKTDQPKPSTDDWAYVTCDACFETGLLRAAWPAADMGQSSIRFAGRFFTLKMETDGAPVGADSPMPISRAPLVLTVQEPDRPLGFGRVRPGLRIVDERRRSPSGGGG